MKKRRFLTSAVVITLSATQLLTPLSAFAADSNPTSGSTQMALNVSHWYKVRMPGIIDLTYDEETVTYRDDYKLDVSGEIGSKYLQIETDDVEITDGTNKYTVGNYVGRADAGEKNHKYVFGTGDGEND